MPWRARLRARPIIIRLAVMLTMRADIAHIQLSAPPWAISLRRVDDKAERALFDLGPA